MPCPLSKDSLAVYMACTGRKHVVPDSKLMNAWKLMKAAEDLHTYMVSDMMAAKTPQSLADASQAFRNFELARRSFEELLATSQSS